MKKEAGANSTPASLARLSKGIDLIFAGNSSQTLSPPSGTLKLHPLGRQVLRVLHIELRRFLYSAKLFLKCLAKWPLIMNSYRSACMNGLSPKSVPSFALNNGTDRAAGVVIQPIRNPGKKLLLKVPMWITYPPGSVAFRGGGASPS